MSAGPPREGAPQWEAPQWGAPQHGGLQPPPGPPRTGGPLGGILALLAGLLAIAGTFLPWVTVSAGPLGTLSVDGFDARNYGVLTLVAGLGLAVLSAARLAGRHHVAVRVASGVVGLVVAVLAVAFMIEIRNRLADVPLVHALLTSSTGAGLYVILAGGVLGIGSAFLPHRPRRPPR